MDISVQEMSLVWLPGIAPQVPFPFAARAVIVRSTVMIQSPHGEADGLLAWS